MKRISLAQIQRALKNIKIANCQLVVGIAEGGVVPATLVASKIGCDLKIVHFNYRNEENIPQHRQPILLKKAHLPKNIDKILLVDDVSITGKTLSACKKLFKNHKVSTMVLRGKADYVLFPQICSCVKWPWQLK